MRCGGAAVGHTFSKVIEGSTVATADLPLLSQPIPQPELNCGVSQVVCYMGFLTAMHTVRIDGIWAHGWLRTE
jgi:hypothetical protein